MKFGANLVGDKHRLCMTIVDEEQYTTIRELTNFIKRKFSIAKQIELYLDQYFIPPEYLIKDIIKEDEVITYIPSLFLVLNKLSPKRNQSL